MKTDFKYICFLKIAEKPKTTVWSCRNKKSNEELGQVKWYGPWRQYCFFPSTELATVFNAHCLDDIIVFINSLPRKTRRVKGGDDVE